MESFYEAFINCTHKVLGRNLKPFCLRHCLYLEAIDSPFMKIINGEQVAIKRKDLELAVLICSADSDVLNAILKANTLSTFTMRFHRFKRGSTQFLSYLTDFLAFPDMWDSEDKKHALNAPWILSKATLLLTKSNLSLEEIWTLPLGELMWYIASFAELEGVGQILSDEERKAIEEAERFSNGK